MDVIGYRPHNITSTRPGLYGVTINLKTADRSSSRRT